MQHHVQDQETPEDPATPRLRLGVVADPGLPSDVAAAVVDEHLPDLLSRRVSADVVWEVELEQEALPLDEQGAVPLLELAGERRPQAGWDMFVYLTDLTRGSATQPVLADLSSRDQAALISLPAVGGLRLRHHVRRTLIHLVDRLHHSTAQSSGRRALRRWSEWTSSVRERTSAEHAIDTSLVLVGRRGKFRLLCGMVRNNRPWRLVPHLASATAAAAATAAFGIFYSSIWQLADAMSTLRLIVVSALAIGVMVGWLLFYNHLWDSPRGHRARKETVLYNASTLCTLTLGVSCMYLLLYGLALLSAVVVIDDGYLGSQLGHPADAGDYATVVWLACSMGIVAGALGSSLDSEAAVRQATYSRREQERQANQLRAEAEDPQDQHPRAPGRRPER
ncbi:hypothetical protein [Streptomyces violens]|uniref:hypothetical protein n=1 Tax=Streptomyces violens TaxID=66377 RepID=UPI00068FCE1F|nr:hypothetical protein [Streptomyces violens]